MFKNIKKKFSLNFFRYFIYIYICLLNEMLLSNTILYCYFYCLLNTIFIFCYKLISRFFNINTLHYINMYTSIKHKIFIFYIKIYILFFSIIFSK